MSGYYTLGLLDQSVFPDISVAGPPAFLGTRIDDATTRGWGGRLGAQWQASETVRLGLAYGTKTDLPVEGDRLLLNARAIGLGLVQYRDIEIDGLAQAQDLGLGIAFQATPRLLLAADVTWLDWSNAVAKSTLRARKPDKAGAPNITQRSDNAWRDQYVVALGAAFAATPDVTVYAGWNYGRNPVPEQSTSPIFASIGEHTLTGGVGFQLGNGMTAGVGAEWFLPYGQTYRNSISPFPGRSQERNSYVALHAGLTMRW